MGQGDIERKKAELAARRARLSAEKQAFLETKLQASSDLPARSFLFSPLVTLQSGQAARPPLFLVHPVNGSALCYGGLAHRLDPRLPVYGLQARGLEESAEPDTDIRNMATHYLELVRSVQPHGPFFLGGWSFGGWAALEMAQQLQGQGQTVAMLALIDSQVPTSLAPVQAEDAAFAIGFGLALGLPLRFPGLEHLDLDEQFARGREQLSAMSRDDQIAFVVDQARQARLIPAGVTDRQMQQWFEVYRRNLQAMRDYVAQPYAGRLTVFSATELLGRLDSDDESRWRAWTAGPLDYYPIPGNHYTLMSEPHIAVLANWLVKHMASLQDSQEQTHEQGENQCR